MRVVICGAGTAGCVAAARLSQDPALEVTLLEVGPHHRPGRWPPGARRRLAAHRPRAARPGGGGSSVTNGAIALRGHPEHYDEWDALVDGYGGGASTR